MRQLSHLLCFGLGYSARVLAHRVGADGWRVTRTSRNRHEPGCVCFDRDHPLAPAEFAGLAAPALLLLAAYLPCLLVGNISAPTPPPGPWRVHFFAAPCATLHPPAGA